MSFRVGSGTEILGDIGKNITDSTKPYKSNFHLLRDVATPFRSVYHVVLGAVQMVLAVPIELFNIAAGVISPDETETRLGNFQNSLKDFLARQAEGFSRIMLGVSLAAMTIFTPFKMLARGVVTAFSEPLLVEKNPGMQRLVHQSYEILKECGVDQSFGRELDGTKNEESIPGSIKKLSALSVDIHRKYHKSMERGQITNIDEKKETELFKECIDQTNPQSFVNYLSLFKPKTTKGVSDVAAELGKTPSLDR